VIVDTRNTEADLKRFNDWFFEKMTEDKRKIFKKLWKKGFFNRVRTAGSPFLFDTFLFSSQKKQEEMLADKNLKEYFEELKPFDLSEKDVDGIVSIWRCGVLDEYAMIEIDKWMENGSTTKSPKRQDTSNDSSE
jgi:hypothetical protein